jgi:hypothetical protein
MCLVSFFYSLLHIYFVIKFTIVSSMVDLYIGQEICKKIETKHFTSKYEMCLVLLSYPSKFTIIYREYFHNMFENIVKIFVTNTTIR